MLDRIFPRQFDNAYRGHWLGLVLFVLIIALKAIQGFNSIVWTHTTMVGADGIPVDSFSPVAASEATTMAIVAQGRTSGAIPSISSARSRGSRGRRRRARGSPGVPRSSLGARLRTRCPQ